MFEPVKSWSLPDHLYMVSAWSAQVRHPFADELRNAIKRAVSGRPVQPRGQADAGHRRPRASTWPGPISPGCSTPRTSAGATSCRAARSRTARTTRRDLQAGAAGRQDAGDLEPAAAVRRRAAGPADRRTSRTCGPTTGRPRRARCPRQLDRPVRAGQRAPARQRPPGPGPCDRAHQRGNGGPGLELHGDLPVLGRLGRVLRPRGAAADRRQRLRAPGARAGHLPVREAGVHRPPGAQQRRVPEVHRGRLPRRRRGSTPHTDGRPDRRPDVRENQKLLGNLETTSTSASPPARRCCSRSTRPATRQTYPPTSTA